MKNKNKKCNEIKMGCQILLLILKLLGLFSIN
jgi:hypothetical protein